MKITVTDISASDLETQIAIMNVDKPTNIKTIEQGNGLFTIIGEFPDDSQKSPTESVPSSSTAEGHTHSETHSGKEGEAMDFFVSQGWSPEQAAGIVANLKAESNFKPTILGDGGKAYGIAQWHPDRQDDFKQVFGHSIQQSTFEEQLQFVQHELKHKEKNAGNKLLNASTAKESGEIISRHYERPADADGAARQRGKSAEEILQNFR